MKRKVRKRKIKNEKDHHQHRTGQGHLKVIFIIVFVVDEKKTAVVLKKHYYAALVNGADGSVGVGGDYKKLNIKSKTKRLLVRHVFLFLFCLPPVEWRQRQIRTAKQRQGNTCSNLTGRRTSL